MNSEPGDTCSEQAAMENISLGFLRASQITMIDEALAAVGEFGEVHLVVENRRLRFVVTQRSSDVLKWQPGSLAGSAGRPGHGPSAR